MSGCLDAMVDFCLGDIFGTAFLGICLGYQFGMKNTDPKHGTMELHTFRVEPGDKFFEDMPAGGQR